jgi:hypothetical protein
MILTVIKYYSFLGCLYLWFFNFCRAPDVAELLGMMVEDYKRIQPNARTYA